MNLIDWLKVKQGEQSDGAFAQGLGIDRATWNLLKNGKKQPGLKVLKAVLAAFPNDRDTILLLGIRVTPHTDSNGSVAIAS